MQAVEKPVPTSLKLPPHVKQQIDAAARADGLSPHAYMVRVLQKDMERRQLRERFVQDALDAEAHMLQEGGHDWDEVKAYFAARRRGETPPRPALKPVPR